MLRVDEGEPTTALCETGGRRLACAVLEYCGSSVHVLVYAVEGQLSGLAVGDGKRQTRGAFEIVQRFFCSLVSTPFREKVFFFERLSMNEAKFLMLFCLIVRWEGHEEVEEESM